MLAKYKHVGYQYKLLFCKIYKNSLFTNYTAEECKICNIELSKNMPEHICFCLN